MIRSDAGLQQTLDQLGKLYSTLASLKTAHPGANPEWLALMAEGILDQIHQLQHQIEDYAGPTPTEQHTGRLRAIDLDELSATVRDEANSCEVRCLFDDALLPSVKAALDRSVKVSGVRQNGSRRAGVTTLRLSRIEIVDPPIREATSTPQLLDNLAPS